MPFTFPESLVDIAAVRTPNERWYHIMGRALIPLVPAARHARSAFLQQVAEELFGGAKVKQMLYDCIRFAKIYKESDLQNLEGFGWRKIRCLLSVPNPKLRATLMKAAKDNNWTARKMLLEVQERLGKRHIGGPRHRSTRLPPKSACRETMRLCTELTERMPSWLRNAGEAASQGTEGEALVASTRAHLRAVQRLITAGLRQL